MQRIVPRHLFLLMLIAAAGYAGCRDDPAFPPSPNVPAAGKVASEPVVRVRISKAIQTIHISGPSKVTIEKVGAPKEQSVTLSTPFTLSMPGGLWSVSGTQGVNLGTSMIHLQALGPNTIFIDRQPYPGSFRLAPTRSDNPLNDISKFDVINHLRLELYLPGVLARELFDTWKPATYLAQAIVARTYAIDRLIKDGPGRLHDVESTQASQAYIGSTAHPLALSAVRDTAGLVLTWEGRVIPAYYSSCCGGVPARAGDAFGRDTIPPLDAVQTHNFCSISPQYQWNTLSLDRATLSKRLRLWGKFANNNFQKINLIQKITVAKRNTLGRPTRFTITDIKDATFNLSAEGMRIACNYTDSAAGLPAPANAQTIRSGYFEAEVRGDKVVIFNGRGFGHGVGMCQWGAEGMARQGQDAQAILRLSYPGAKLERAY